MPLSPLLNAETTPSAAAFVPASIASSCCATQPSSAAAACSPVTQGLVRVANAEGPAHPDKAINAAMTS
jgi:hypothetical protein